MKRLLVAMALTALMLTSCQFPQVRKEPPIQHKVQIDVVVDSKGVVVKDDQIQQGSLSPLSFVARDEAYIKIFSALTVGDVTNLWNDIIVLYKRTSIRTINLFINSPGGDAFSGLALADKITMAKKLGFTVNGYASGIVASAAVPVIAVCDHRVAAEGVIFMVHETSIWKWPGRETASDIRSQNRLMNMLRDRYLGKLVRHTKISREDWEEMEHKTTWFDAELALKIGLIDEIEREE